VPASAQLVDIDSDAGREGSHPGMRGRAHPVRTIPVQRPPGKVASPGSALHAAGERSRDVSPRRYEFRVAGRLSDETRAAFPGLKVIDVPAETLIYGDVVDESHLHGVLAMIQNLGLRVVSLNQIPD
jgi:hypothetical protein